MHACMCLPSKLRIVVCSDAILSLENRGGELERGRPADPLPRRLRIVCSASTKLLSPTSPRTYVSSTFSVMDLLVELLREPVGAEAVHKHLARVAARKADISRDAAALLPTLDYLRPQCTVSNIFVL